MAGPLDVGQISGSAGGDHNTARGHSAAERRQADNRDTEIRRGEVDTTSTQGVCFLSAAVVTQTPMEADSAH